MLSYVSLVNEPFVFSGVERFGNSLRPPLSWLGVSVVALTAGFRPQLNADATIVAAIRLTALYLVVMFTLTLLKKECEAPCGPFGYWYLTLLPGRKPPGFVSKP